MFACIVGCFAGALTIGEQTIVQMVDHSGDDTLAYRFESRFDDSYLLNDPAREMTTELVYALKQNMTQTAFNRYIGDRFPGDYYAKMGDTVLKNADLTEEDALNAAYYVVARPNETETNMLLWSGDVFDGSVYSVEPYDSQFTQTVKGDYPTNTVMLLRITAEQAAPLRAEWQTQRDSIYNVLNRVVMLTAAGLLLFVFLLFVTGRRGGDEDVHLVTIDRLPVEVNALLFWSVLLFAGGLNVALMLEIVDGASDMCFLLMPAIVFCAAAFALAMELALSRARHQEPQLRQAELVPALCPLVLETGRALCALVLEDARGHLARSRPRPPRSGKHPTAKLQNAQCTADLCRLLGRPRLLCVRVRRDAERDDVPAGRHLVLRGGLLPAAPYQWL